MAQGSKRLRLIGKTISPIVIQSPFFFIKGCKVSITKYPIENERGYFPYPKKQHLGKLIKGVRKAPTTKKCFQGFVVVDFPGQNNQTEKKLRWFLSLKGLGTRQQEGMGKILWLERKLVARVKRQPPVKKWRIRKGLGHYPRPMHQVLKALLLHDFVHTEKHQSKIYQEVEIADPLVREACKKHHNGEDTNNWLIPIIKKYDGLAALINRKIPNKK